MNNLTQKWKDGKLEVGLYYVKYNDGRYGRANLILTPDYYGFFNNCSLDDDIATVLAKVPDYTSWQNMKNVAAGEHQINKLLIRDREKLTQLLKDCHSAFCRNLVENEELTKDETITLLTKIEKTFKEIGVNNGKEAG